MRFLLICLLAGIPVHGYAQAPGNVSANLRWWLRADAGVFIDNGTTLAANGQAVQQWNDQSTVLNHATQATAANKPTYATNRINGNPALLFTGNMFITANAAPGIASNQSLSMFLVFKQNSYLTTGNVGDGNGTFIVDRTPETNNLMSFKISSTNKFNYQKRSDSGANLEGPHSATVAPTGTFNILNFYRIFGNSYGIYMDGRLDVSTTSNVNDAITGPVIRLGRHAVNANQGLNGEMAEVILYNASPSAAERRRIESYLAIKYGIALDQTTLTNYVNSTGNTVYPVATDATYNAYSFDIAGIARDNNTYLAQSASQSQNTNSVLRVSNPSALDNGDYLMWGSNNGSLTTPTTSGVDGTLIKRRLSRVWRIAETNDVGTVTLSFDLSAVPGPKVQADLRLLIDRDGDGFGDNDQTPISGTLSGSVFTVTGVNLVNGDYITIGTVNATATPLPVALVSFEVAPEGSAVVATWKTASELNNDYFTLERSATGSQWHAITDVDGNGTTQQGHRYQAVDSAPLPGRSYYRLKQTDFDGAVSYSSVQSVYRESADGIAVYPNPLKGDIVYVRSDRWLEAGSTVELLNLQQQKVRTLRLQRDDNDPQAFFIRMAEPLAPGLYILSFEASGRRAMMKLVID